MTFRVELRGELAFDDDDAAAAAFAAMTAGREDNEMLREAARLSGRTILFAFEGFLSVERGTDLIESTTAGLEKALVTARTGAVEYADESGERRTMPALGRGFWSERWRQGAIGFHEGAANDLLVASVAELERGRGKLRILVPLAGKADDMAWLADRGHEVVGVEFVIDAVEAFFAARGVDLGSIVTRLGSLDAFAHGGVTMLCQDFFRLTAEDIGNFDALYDRAALVAVEPAMRARYVEVCRALCKPDARALVIAMSYDQSKTGGPPWSCDRDQVLALFPNARALQTRSVPTSPRLTAAGVPALEETAYLVDPVGTQP
jgi:thiopurine S-methyltransferase